MRLDIVMDISCVWSYLGDDAEERCRNSRLSPEQQLGERIAERLFRACYADGLDVGDKDVLATLAAEIGVAA